MAKSCTYVARARAGADSGEAKNVAGECRQDRTILPIRVSLI